MGKKDKDKDEAKIKKLKKSGFEEVDITRREFISVMESLRGIRFADIDIEVSMQLHKSFRENEEKYKTQETTYKDLVEQWGKKGEDGKVLSKNGNFIAKDKKDQEKMDKVLNDFLDEEITIKLIQIPFNKFPKVIPHNVKQLTNGKELITNYNELRPALYNYVIVLEDDSTTP